MALLLAGDIGGTKVDLYLINNNNPQLLPPLYQKRYSTGDYADFVAMVKQFFQEAEQELHYSPVPQKACFAIAGPVENNVCQMTNLNWVLDGRELQDSLKILKVKLINDFAAIGYGIPALKNSDLVTLQDVKPQDGSPKAIIGAGTGLGEAFLLPKSDEQHYQPHATEGSHADLAPIVTNELKRFDLNEYDLLEYIRQKLNLQHVSVERVVSGPGIITIYQFLRDQTHWRESDEIQQIVNRWETSNDEIRRQIEDPVRVITKAALDNTDLLCEKTMKIFIKFYGAEAGNLAVKVLPYGGLYVAGGITTHIIDLIKEGDFLDVFLNKGRMRSLLQKIPIYLVTNPPVGVIGSAIYISQD